jgi:hypothetical protein
LAARLFTSIRILDLDRRLMTFDEGKPNGGEPQLDGCVGKSEHSATSKNICSELLFQSLLPHCLIHSRYPEHPFPKKLSPGALRKTS